MKLSKSDSFIIISKFYKDNDYSRIDPSYSGVPIKILQVEKLDNDNMAIEFEFMRGEKDEK